MNSDQRQLKALLTSLVAGQDYPIVPATKEQVVAFQTRAAEQGVDPLVINQLVNLYEVADSFYYEIIIEFFQCNDEIMYEWWSEKELWLGLRDFYVIRWSNYKFCLGDASNVSFSEAHEHDTLIGLLQGCLAEVREAEQAGEE